MKANGAEVLRADYPRLVRLADTYSLWTNDTANNLGKFGVGDGETTFVLPNWVDRMEQLSDTAGGTVEAGLPNIEGVISVPYGSSSGIARLGIDGSGAFVGESISTRPYASSYGSYSSAGFLRFKASNSSAVYSDDVTTVQSPAIKTIPIMRY